MASADAFTSNGTCYYGPGKKADPAYIPCGNAVFGTVPCCQAGDYCLSNNACFNNQFGNTYWAGCTNGDSYENEAACPRKYTLREQQWVGIVRCMVSNDKSKQDEIWQGCHESVQPLNTIGDACKCTTNQVGGLFTKAGPDLPRVALLPTTSGGHITFASGYGPSNTAVTATSKVNLTELTIAPPPMTPASGWSTLFFGTTITGGSAVPYTGLPAPTGARDSDDSDDIDDRGGLSTGAKAGIGIGAGLGGLALLGILWCLFLLNRRLARGNGREKAVAATPSMGPSSPGLDYQQHYDYGPLQPPSKPSMTVAFAHPSELEGSHYQTVGAEEHGWKSELPAENNVGADAAELADVAAATSHGTPVPNPGFQHSHLPPASPATPGMEPVSAHTGSEEYPYSRDRGSVVSSTRSSEYNAPHQHGFVSPQSTSKGGGHHDHGRSASQGQSQLNTMDSIDEMHG